MSGVEPRSCPSIVTLAFEGSLRTSSTPVEATPISSTYWAVCTPARICSGITRGSADPARTCSTCVPGLTRTVRGVTPWSWSSMTTRAPSGRDCTTSSPSPPSPSLGRESSHATSSDCATATATSAATARADRHHGEGGSTAWAAATGPGPGSGSPTGGAVTGGHWMIGPAGVAAAVWAGVGAGVAATRSGSTSTPGSAAFRRTPDRLRGGGANASSVVA